MHLTRNLNRASWLRRPRALLAIAAVGVVAAVAVPSIASATATSNGHATPPVHVTVLTPSRGGNAGAGGVFSVDVSLEANGQRPNAALTAADGYQPFFNNPGSPTFGPGRPDPGAPGLVVLLSTTPDRAGGPNANLAGVFQLNAVEQVHQLNTTFNDWQVGVPGFFGTDVDATLTVFVVDGTAPGIVDMSNVHPISNVETVHFHIAG
jgi:hypothetical protein